MLQVLFQFSQMLHWIFEDSNIIHVSWIYINIAEIHVCIGSTEPMKWLTGSPVLIVIFDKCRFFSYFSVLHKVYWIYCDSLVLLIVMLKGIFKHFQ